MNFEDTIDMLRRSNLNIDCQSMVLKQRAGGSAIYRGKGYVKQNETGGLIYKIYVDSHENATPFQHLDPGAAPRPGQLFADDMLYNLTAMAMDGTTWVSERLFPSANWNMSDRSVIVEGKIDTMRAELGNGAKAHCQRLHFFEELELPLHQMTEAERNGRKWRVRDTAKFTGMNSDFEVRVREGFGDTVINVSSTTAFPEAFHLRVQEALQYITSTSTNWHARLEGTPDALFLELRSPREQSRPSRFPSPLRAWTPEFFQHGWKLFVTFLTYVINNNTGGHLWSPIAYQLYVAREAASSTIDAAAVGVSVALEAIASLVCTPSHQQEEARLALFQKHMRELLASLSPDFADFAPRVEGLLTTMGTKRPQDTLYALADLGAVEGAYIKSSANLRVRHVHPRLGELKPFDMASAQGLLDDIRKAEVLVHQLVFHLVGYRGPFTDYGVEGYPSKMYPLSS